MNTKQTELTVVDQQGKAGRPTKYEPVTVNRLLSGLADGLTKEQACVAAGIGVSTLADWLERYPQLAQRVGQAREQARQKALAGIKKAGENGDWRALEAFLRLSFPKDYRRADTRVEVTATAQQASVITISPEEQAKLAAAHARRVEALKAQYRRIYAQDPDIPGEAKRIADSEAARPNHIINVQAEEPDTRLHSHAGRAGGPGPDGRSLSDPSWHGGRQR
jgi:hypothetical protein